MNKVFAAFWYSGILPLLSCTTTIPTTTTTAAAFENHESLSRPQSAKKEGMKAKQNRKQNGEKELEKKDKKKKKGFLWLKDQWKSVADKSSACYKKKGVEGESAQRCKARLERHRRTAERAAKALAEKKRLLEEEQHLQAAVERATAEARQRAFQKVIAEEAAFEARKRVERSVAERAAKALAEKNMRDLLAERVQAERNRLAEALDAEVKRWSSGKEANLRALLSTLQYILGPDSGWQPIPLTEVITSAAVKKAYRKATLCVHPDKLQQRGASVQQKYICEKVFDLLKEAWNRFNSEEQRNRSKQISTSPYKTRGKRAAKALAEKKRLLEEEQHLQAAVERATAEARQRAFQKVIAEEAAFEARKRVERSVAERAAKALAEKNMRDLLAERVQAERNRLAEALDAEVKRWSSGKEANLRALLSTLQYILGPDSGWQPIPLTEVITSAAVKKAYRKATLCVHPDKLQQRGASVQQKYICEKVFDLLKEAWNRFNSEEQRNRSKQISTSPYKTRGKRAAKALAEKKRLLEEEQHLQAAVERATAEARQRAFQKVIAEEAAFEARKRVERSVAERAAKALAEKNMRNLLAEREQAERNRLAEALDAEVKRWSSGKEANLRALLSTLQYILGPESGWQPIPLTEVITSAAVKKAYRKATLCVHPDKLQQRGASVQQKYICEKVFDLLKEAWNRFNSEEQRNRSKQISTSPYKTRGKRAAKTLAEKKRLLEEEQHLQAAVERATAEARQRPFQKVIAEEAAFEARKHVERSVAERAAKALAEKNMRDLLAEREQAERNRLAKALDAEVKRWSSGKEANLRALLSTLQYILGPDSGWQPIPLTEVINSAAVKKAYRKATLCVHPDKLQQRGASVQQKYICEKVFDLLKEAWNGFNSEEQ